MQKLFNLIWKLDQKIIEILEKISQTIQLITGFDNIWQARLSILIFLILDLANGLLGYNYWIIVIWTMIQNLKIYSLLENIGHRLNRENISGLSNSLKVSNIGIMIRFFSVMMLIIYFNLLFLDTRYLPDVPFVTLTMYLICCDPLPPCKGKIKEWLKSLSLTPKVAEIKT